MVSKEITLINPPSPFLNDEKVMIPLGILYIASSLKKASVKVNFVDLAGNPNAKIPTGFTYGITSTTPQYLYAVDVLSKIPNDSSIVIGGPQATVQPQECSKHFDAVIVGEGEKAILRFVEGERGLIKEKPIKNLDEIPFPDRSLVKNYSYKINGIPATTMVTSRGCYYRKCAFCLPKGTKIIKSKGKNDKIEKIKVGDKLIGYDDENDKLVETTVIRTMKRTSKSLYKIILENGNSLEITPEHPVFTNRGWIKVKNLNINDKILVISPNDKISFNKKLYNPMKNHNVALKSSKNRKDRIPWWIKKGVPHPMKNPETKRKGVETRKARYESGEFIHPLLGEKRPDISNRMLGDNNPMKNPEVASRMRRTLKKKIKSGEFTPFMCTEEGIAIITELARERALTNNPMWDPEVERKRLESWRKSYTPEKHPLWKGGISIKYPPEYNETLRNEVKKLHGYVCQDCGISESECKEKFGFVLDVHHIDHDKMNSNMKNLVPLCRKHHFVRHWEERGDCPHFVGVELIKKIPNNNIVYNFECEPYDNYFAEYTLVHNCCQNWGNIRFRSAENVIEELKEIRLKYGYHAIMFYDDEFLCNRKRDFKICFMLGKLGFIWRCFSRADLIDKTVASVASTSGCREMLLGFESGSDRILQNINKGCTVEQNKKAIEILNTFKIRVKAAMIIMLPGESFETLKETWAFCEEMEPYVSDWDFTICTPYPKSDIYENPERYDFNFHKSAIYSAYKGAGNETWKPPRVCTKSLTFNEGFKYRGRFEKRFKLKQKKVSLE